MAPERMVGTGEDFGRGVGDAELTVGAGLKPWLCASRVGRPIGWENFATPSHACPTHSAQTNTL